MGISELVTPGGEVTRVEDDGDYPLFCVADLQTGATDPQVILFNYTRGQDVARTRQTAAALPRTAQIRDTNVESPQRMGEDEGMTIVSMRCEVLEHQCQTAAGTGDTTETFLGQEPGVLGVNLDRLGLWTVLRLQISGEKDYEVHSPLWFAAGYGAYHTFAGTAAAITSVAVNGMPQHPAARFVRVPHTIAPGEQYRVVLENPDGKTMVWLPPTGQGTTDTQLRLRVTLEGMRKRAVGAMRFVAYERAPV